MSDDRQKQTRAKGVTRRTFVQIGAAGLAIAAAPRVLAKPDAAAEGTRRSEARQHRGAIFFTRYSADGRGWEGVRTAPALGQYSSGDVGALDTHVTLAKKYGLSFFLAESATDDRRDYRTRNLERLYERADLHAFKAAVLLAGFKPGRGAAVATAADAWLAARLQKFVSSAALEHDSYLRDESGRAIVAVDAGGAAREMAAAARRLFDGTDLHQSMWLWVIGDGTSQPVTLAPGIAWVAQPQPTGLREALRQEEVALLTMSPETRGPGIATERLSAYSRSRYVVIDSFNDWKRGTALEATARDRSRSVYVASLGKQLDLVLR